MAGAGALIWMRTRQVELDREGEGLPLASALRGFRHPFRGEIPATPPRPWFAMASLMDTRLSADQTSDQTSNIKRSLSACMLSEMFGGPIVTIGKKASPALAHDTTSG